MSRLTDLRAQLRGGEKTLFDRFSQRISRVESWRPIFGAIAVLGALIAAVARAINGDLGLGLVIFGATLAAVRGGLVVLMDYRKLEISQEAKDAYALADAAITELDMREVELANVQRVAQFLQGEATGLDKRRLARIDAVRLMIESVEAALLSDADANTSARKLLMAAIGSLQRAVDYRAGDFLTFTIFRVAGSAHDSLEPIAREWTDRGRSAEIGRAWHKGQGYTGVLWSLAESNPRASVVEPDTSLADVHGKYPVLSRDDEREMRYRSVASFPILVGKGNQVWGAVTATSDRVGVFDHSGNVARQSVETVRDVALIASLLAKLRT